MNRLIVAICVLAGCSANTPADGADMADTGDFAWELDEPDTAEVGDLEPTVNIALVLGPRQEPFTPWTENAEVVVVQGPQGGYHTEHRALVTGVSSTEELHLAIIFGEVWRNDLVMARAGWEFWDDQWVRGDEGFEVELPVLIFDEQPEFGPAELRATLELPDGRTANYTLTIDLVDF